MSDDTATKTPEQLVAESGALELALPRRRARPALRVVNGTDLSERGVAEVFATRHGQELRYCHTTSRWLRWDGSVWRVEETRLAFDYAQRLANELGETASADPRAMATLGRANFAGGVERLAQANRAFAVTASVWNTDPMLLGTPGGTVDLRTGKLRTAKPADLISRAAAVAPAERAQCPNWLRFLHDATGGDHDLMRFLQRWCGYTLTGDTREQALLFIYGPGGNGKSVFLNTLSGILGDYHSTAAMDAFTEAGNGKHLAFLAMLAGARMVSAAETEEGRAWAETRIKEMTGGTPVTANFMRRDPFTFTPAFKLTISGNHKPVLRNVDDAARRRFNIVPFTHKPPRPDPLLEHKLREEWPAIFRWMIEGCLEWQNDGLRRPAIVLAATEEYFDAQDVFGQWTAERCTLDPSMATPPAHLLADFNAWARRNNEGECSRTRFRGWADRQPGLRYKTVKGSNFLQGIGLRPLQREEEG